MEKQSIFTFTASSVWFGLALFLLPNLTLLLFIFVILFVAIAPIALCHPLPKAFGTAVAKSYACPQKTKRQPLQCAPVALRQKQTTPKLNLHNTFLIVQPREESTC